MNINYKINKGMDTNEVIALCLTPELEMDGTIIKNKYPEGIAEDIYFINEDRFLLPVGILLIKVWLRCIEKGINKVNM